jgi:hypothetical protein
LTRLLRHAPRRPKVKSAVTTPSIPSAFQNPRTLFPELRHRDHRRCTSASRPRPHPAPRRRTRTTRQPYLLFGPSTCGRPALPRRAQAAAASSGRLAAAPPRAPAHRWRGRRRASSRRRTTWATQAERTPTTWDLVAWTGRCPLVTTRAGSAGQRASSSSRPWWVDEIGHGPAERGL